MDANVSTHRLRFLSTPERALYGQLFRSLGGDTNGAPVPASGVTELLQKSGLQPNTLRRIWEVADEHHVGSLDFESFCVACRLCAHAQLRPPGAPLPEELVAETPVVPPNFQASGPPGASQGPAEPEGFDFEAAALGMDTGSSRASKRPSRPPTSSADAGAGFGFVPPTLRPQARSGDVLPSPSKLEEEEDSVGYGSAALLEDVLPGGKAKNGRRRTPMERLGHEMLQVRRQMDKQGAKKSRLEQRIEKLSAHLRTAREERQKTKLEVLKRQADLEHMWATLDFQRRQIREAERETAALREARRAFDEADLARIERRFGPLTTVQALLEDTGAAEAAVAAHRGAAQDLRSAAELAEQARRAMRKKMELQAQQQLLLASQQQAEQERSYAQREMDAARREQAAVQRDRVDVGRERLGALREAASLAKSVGLGGRHAKPASDRRGVPQDPSRSQPSQHRGRVAAGLATAAQAAEAPPSAMLAPSGAAGSLAVDNWMRFSKEDAGDEPGAFFWKGMLGQE